MCFKRRVRSVCALAQSDQQSSVGTFWIVKDVQFLLVENEDINQTARMSRLISIFAGRKCQMVRYLTLRPIYSFGTTIHIRYKFCL